ncbi:hypothetical protein [Noviherbaspirillum sp.]|uniref:hypothetical protein n=1 Tax=Noviherbaspirillum sp. TaxID=1926288 RepID=UPI002D672166|nr:hypothetical protein [Noviherbaspirillum sp.]HZW22305.1 hypothetical protein [Noviherbaspirillum sp.]
MKKIKTVIAISALGALLNGCGGGGDADVGSDATAAGTSAAATNTTPSDPIDKYLGTIVLACSPNAWITNPDTGAVLNERLTLTSQSKSNATKALFQFKHDVYDTADCSGAPRATLTVSGANTWLNVDGGTTVNGMAADKVSSSEGVKLPGISAGTAITVNGVRYNAKYVAQTTSKDLLAFVGKDLYFGDHSKAPDADGYPTALRPQPTGTMK